VRALECDDELFAKKYSLLKTINLARSLESDAASIAGNRDVLSSRWRELVRQNNMDMGVGRDKKQPMKA
jgi:hypothetical protein